MEFKYHAFDRSPSEFFPRQVIGVSTDDVRHAQNIGSSSATNFYLNQIPEQSHYQLAVSSYMRHAPNCISNLEVHTVTQRNNPLEDVKYDAIQWQLEKHRIRKEIISSEIERRRMLEIEVRRELEQEMAMLHAANRFTFQERSPMCFNQRVSYVDRVDSQMMLEARTVGAGTTDNVFGLRYPLQSLPGATQSGINSEDGSRIIMLAKPTPDLTGAKRKLIYAPPGHCPNELLSNRIKKPREEHSCALCKVSTTSAKGLNDHLQGKKHKMMEQMLRAGKLKIQRAPKYKFLKGKAIAGTRNVSEEETDKNLIQPAWKGLNDISSGNEDETKVTTKAETCPEVPNKTKKIFKFWCEPCRVGAFSKTVFETHMKGKKHRGHLGLKGEVASDNDFAATAKRSAKSASSTEVLIL